jgi:hypothetical protein
VLSYLPSFPSALRFSVLRTWRSRGTIDEKSSAFLSSFLPERVAFLGIADLEVARNDRREKQ